MGVGRASVAGPVAVAEMASVAQIHAALGELRAYWHRRIGSFVAKTPDADFDSMINVWNAYNC